VVKGACVRVHSRENVPRVPLKNHLMEHTHGT